ncbi:MULTISPECIES: hypothetical protein [unclassified Moorena]|uniref:hypothetical protein n=1 Tax=unclassified Moorena TaxID=2683338 RepID=UPI0013FEEB3F|nr:MULTISPECIES: hypothetical protein [unclassified Moorena]NEO16916.1 hypothetical protein [Moorena sp. SIO3E8]NEQ02423.1 hypothetical protein [Moorena sp. SIO3F7]
MKLKTIRVSIDRIPESYAQVTALPFTVSGQWSAVSRQPSAVSGQPSAVIGQLILFKSCSRSVCLAYKLIADS